jgi:D-alanine-D-alanine ligase-like ATP-grasp enzyme
LEVARRAIAAGGEWIAERLVQGTELTVGVIELANGQVEALPCSEVRVSPGRAFDYEGKYLGSGTKEVLETNTWPGLSVASFIPQQLRAAGIALSAFIEDQVAIGRRRAATGC